MPPDTTLGSNPASPKPSAAGVAQGAETGLRTGGMTGSGQSAPATGGSPTGGTQPGGSGAGATSTPSLDDALRGFSRSALAGHPAIQSLIDAEADRRANSRLQSHTEEARILNTWDRFDQLHAAGQNDAALQEIVNLRRGVRASSQQREIEQRVTNEVVGSLNETMAEVLTPDQITALQAVSATSKNPREVFKAFVGLVRSGAVSGATNEMGQAISQSVNAISRNSEPNPSLAGGSASPGGFGFSGPGGMPNDDELDALTDNPDQWEPFEAKLRAQIAQAQ